jgi:ferrous iron transport protein B
MKRVYLVGTPNVGKSVLFHCLTGKYVTVSNYPGTTVDISRGRTNIMGMNFEVVDTPGIYSLLPITDEERVTRAVLLQDTPDLVLHVVDAKNLGRMLNMTLQLLEAGLTVILVINMMDEAAAYGIRIDVKMLEHVLGIPVVLTTAAHKKGIADLRGRIHAQAKL